MSLRTVNIHDRDEVEVEGVGQPGDDGILAILGQDLLDEEDHAHCGDPLA